MEEEETLRDLNYAYFLSSRSKYQSALEVFTKILSHHPTNVSAIAGKANCLKHLSHKKEALECLSYALTLNPSDVATLFYLATIYKEGERYPDAILSLDKILKQEHDKQSEVSLSIDFFKESKELLAVIYTDLGTKLKLLGNIEQAMEKYQSAISIWPTYAPAYYNIAVVYSEALKYDDALKYYQLAIERNCYYTEAYCNIGVIYKSIGRLTEAITFYGNALAVNPNFTIAKNNMAIALTDYGTKVKNEGKIKEGIKSYKKALLYNSQYADAYYNLGVAYGETFRFERAIVYYELAIHFNPLCCEAYNNLGVIYKDLDNTDKAIQSYLSALAINPKFAQTLNNIGVIYTMQGKVEDAYVSLKSAILENPGYAEAYNNLGVLYRDEGKIEESIDCYKKCLELNPRSRNALQNRLLALNYAPKVTVQEIYEEHVKFGKVFETFYMPLYNTLKISKRQDNIIRVGYVSPDFFTHSVSYFIEGVLANHNKEKFMVTCYSNVVKEDNKTLRLKTLPNVWRNIYGRTAEEVAKIIHEDEIDILVELAGHTAGNRLDVMAMKPAPIQITYLGYPNTTGLSRIDYRITDSIVDPVDTKQQFTEKLLRMPNCFLSYTPSLEAGNVVPLPCLVNGFITFGSFNNLAKINSNVIKVWASILKAVKNSRLLVKCKPFNSHTIRDHFLGSFEKEGIDPSRIDLLSLLPLNGAHLQSYQLMDLSLDTFPYTGTTTTCEALYMGVPVVTLVKESNHVHNVGKTLLTSVGYPSWIATTQEEYIKKAIDLASDFEHLKELRTCLRTKMLDSHLCNSKQFTRDLEQKYAQLVENSSK